ncbi:MAG: hypothetical protein ACXW4A_05335 [Nitrospira sp.]
MRLSKLMDCVEHRQQTLILDVKLPSSLFTRECSVEHLPTMMARTLR